MPLAGLPRSDALPKDGSKAERSQISHVPEPGLSVAGGARGLWNPGLWLPTLNKTTGHLLLHQALS